MSQPKAAASSYAAVKWVVWSTDTALLRSGSGAPPVRPVNGESRRTPLEGLTRHGSGGVPFAQPRRARPCATNRNPTRLIGQGSCAVTVLTAQLSNLRSPPQTRGFCATGNRWTGRLFDAPDTAIGVGPPSRNWTGGLRMGRVQEQLAAPALGSGSIPSPDCTRPLNAENPPTAISSRGVRSLSIFET
jgi:hypothetical protein